ncbi:hypothetical protein ACFL6M_04630 [Candidatus Eisenbacteria bacterium]|uniref:Cortical protein marker for cell polarity n=1 Tax=Eiseniibacteriota bacterium TaxID=2212470 RepID=A0ABV6YKJ3_UNCEI
MKRCIQFCLLSVVAASLAGSTHAAPSGAAVPSPDPLRSISVGDFLTPDGRFDLQAARRAGFEGALDPSGFRVRFDPATREPIFNGATQEESRDVGDENWHPGFHPRGTNSRVNALTVWNGSLILGGAFNTAGNQAFVDGLARWDGISWYPLGAGVDWSVMSLTTYDGDLIAGGYFTEVDGVPANCIARWDGASWYALGSGMSSGSTTPVVFALTEYNGSLIAGGMFDTAGGVSANNIAKWDGSNWYALGSGIEEETLYPAVYALVEYDGNLIAGGEFDTAGGITAHHIASWNGSSWSSMGGVSGADAYVYTLTTYDASLIAGGDFSAVGGVSADNIAS